MIRLTAAALLVATATSAASAYEFRIRFVERTGPAIGGFDTPLHDNTVYVPTGQERRIRIQFGIFDDAAGPAHAGGYVGWNVGTITVNGAPSNSNEYRNGPNGEHNGAGRLTPFNFAPSSGGANGLPAGDPFEWLTGIDNTLGQQGRVWTFGNPLPEPVIRGRNTWVSTFEFSVAPNDNATDYTIDFGGNLIAALEWRQVGSPIKPTEDEPGLVVYVPFADEPRAFNATLVVVPVVPAPTAAMLISLLPLTGYSQRRRVTP